MSQISVLVLQILAKEEILELFPLLLFLLNGLCVFPWKSEMFKLLLLAFYSTLKGLLSDFCESCLLLSSDSAAFLSLLFDRSKTGQSAKVSPGIGRLNKPKFGLAQRTAENNLFPCAFVPPLNDPLKLCVMFGLLEFTDINNEGCTPPRGEGCEARPFVEVYLNMMFLDEEPIMRLTANKFFLMTIFFFSLHTMEQLLCGK